MSSLFKRWDAVLIAGLAAILIAAIGATMTDLGPWYQNLQQPSWRIPDAAFGVVWTVIFSLAALSAAKGWTSTRSPSKRQGLVTLFAFNGFFNVLWSLLFFKMQRPDYALTEVAFLWLTVLALIIYLWPISKRASILLWPYLIWVSIAAFLTYEIVQLNGPFA